MPFNRGQAAHSLRAGEFYGRENFDRYQTASKSFEAVSYDVHSEFDFIVDADSSKTSTWHGPL